MIKSLILRQALGLDDPVSRKPHVPTRLYLLNSVFDNYHERGQSIAGTEHPCDGDGHTIWVRKDVHDAKVRKLEMEIFELECQIEVLVDPTLEQDR